MRTSPATRFISAKGHGQAKARPWPSPSSGTFKPPPRIPSRLRSGARAPEEDPKRTAMVRDALPAIEIRGLTKRFLSTLALGGVDLTIMPAEIHALVGENGAGKSTLIKILAGLYQPDAGKIFVSGRQVHPHSEFVPISFVHQDLGLVDELSIGENVALVAGFPRSGGLISWSKVWRQVEQIYAGMAVEPPDPRALVGSLSAAGKAILGIVRALSRDARVVVLDEPTASLPGPDALHLFEVLHRLRASGTSILYVSHRLNELFGLVDRVTVLRDGQVVRSSGIGDTTPEVDRARHAWPRPRAAAPFRPRARAGAPFLQVENLLTGDQDPVIQVGQGEIVGLVGLRGAGHEAIGRTIFGAHPQTGGTVRLGPESFPGLPISERIRKGIALLAGDRLGESALSGMSLRENLFPNASNVTGNPFAPIDRRSRGQRSERCAGSVRRAARATGRRSSIGSAAATSRRSSSADGLRPARGFSSWKSLPPASTLARRARFTACYAPLRPRGRAFSSCLRISRKSRPCATARWSSAEA